jgi:hypothetical protein
MGNYNFRADLPIAKNTEAKVAALLEQMGFALLDSNDTNAYDLRVEFEGEELKVEVKEDFKCTETGNVAVESHCRGKPSGISVTKADVYAYVIHHTDGVMLTLTHVDDIRNAIANNNYRGRVDDSGDQGSNTVNYLFRVEKFIDMALMKMQFAGW